MMLAKMAMGDHTASEGSRILPFPRAHKTWLVMKKMAKNPMAFVMLMTGFTRVPWQRKGKMKATINNG